MCCSFYLLYAALCSSNSCPIRSNLASLLHQCAHTFPMRLNYLTFRIKINVLLLEIQLTASGEAKAACGESIPDHFCPLLKYVDKRFTQATYKIGKLANILRWFVMSISLQYSDVNINILCKTILKTESLHFAVSYKIHIAVKSKLVSGQTKVELNRYLGGSWLMVGIPITEDSCTIPISLPPICIISLGGIFSLTLFVFLSTKLFTPPLFVLNFTSSVFQWLLAGWFPTLQTTSVYPGIW